MSDPALWPFIVVVGVLGLLIGSFLNVCIVRWPAEQSVVSPRSRCPQCGNLIAWYDNIPVVSWMLLHARCRRCRLPISTRYPLTEGATGGLFALAAWSISGALGLALALGAAVLLMTALSLAFAPSPS